jgi:hypothetical protein
MMTEQCRAYQRIGTGVRWTCRHIQKYVDAEPIACRVNTLPVGAHGTLLTNLRQAQGGPRYCFGRVMHDSSALDG